MLNNWQDVVVVLLIVGASLLFRWLLDYVWPQEQRRLHNDLIGWQLSIVGTTYAVVMGFMLYTVWTNFGLAEVNVGAEANAAMNLYRLGDGLPEPQRSEIRSSVHGYAAAVLRYDWPEMDAGRPLSSQSHVINQGMWQVLMAVRAVTPSEIAAEDHALYELSSLAEHRRIRQLQNNSRLPGVLWWVLIIGGIITIVSSCMFGAGSVWLHGFQVFAVSLLIGLILVAIADIDRPYQGTVSVGDEPFIHIIGTMQEK
jgi:hypothetical protein